VAAAGPAPGGPRGHEGLSHTLAEQWRFPISVAPPEQNWALGGGIYSTMEEPGHCARHITQLRSASQDHRLMKSSPGRVAHRVNRRGIGDACVNGAAVRSLCGGLFRSQDRSRRVPRVRGVRSALQATAADMILGAGPPSRAFRREVFRHESGIPARVGRRRRRTRAEKSASRMGAPRPRAGGPRRASTSTLRSC